MQFKLTKSEFEKLPDELKKEYVLNGESATLKIEGEGAPTVEAITNLETKLRIEKEHRQKAEKDRDSAEKSSEKLREDLTKASGKDELAAQAKKHQEELEKIRNDRENERKAAKQTADAQLITDTTKDFMSEHFTPFGQKYVGPEFSKRLSVEEVDGQSVVRVLDKEGKPSVLSLNELKQEFLDNKELSATIVAQAGSGGGAPAGTGGGAPEKSLKEMTATEEAKFANSNPEEYARMIGETSS